MRRNDREVSNMEEMIEIIKKCDVCRVAFFDEEYPYILPLNFGLSYNGEKIELYFHCAKEGKKLTLIQSNPMVGFEMDCSHELVLSENDTHCTMAYESICGNGEIVMLQEEEKVSALTLLMKQYSDKAEFSFSEGALQAVTVFKIKIHHITGKSLKKPNR